MDSLEELLPDFDDLEKLAIAASQAQLKAEQLYQQIKTGEATCIKQCIDEERFWPLGKKPAETGIYLAKVVPQLGNSEEQKERLAKLRKEYSEARYEAQQARDLLDLGKKRIDVFQTISANRRHTLAL